MYGRSWNELGEVLLYNVEENSNSDLATDQGQKKVVVIMSTWREWKVCLLKNGSIVLRRMEK